MRRFVLFFLLVCFPFCIKAVDVESICSEMSCREQFYLREFFKISIYENHFGYVLFYDKPMSASGFFLKCPSRELENPYKNKLLKKGWYVWKKYEHKIPHAGFIFCEDANNFIDIENNHKINSCNIYLISKRNLKLALHDHIDCFQQRLGEHFSPNEFFQKVEKTKSILSHLHGDEMLLGILLGYGRDAPNLFYLNEQSSQPIPLTRLSSSSSKEGKIQPVVFMGNPCSKETQKTICNYHGQADSIEQLCQCDDILKSVLKTLLQS